ncbi:MAG: SDR family oxidoreductase [Sphingomonadaceae bacterium]|nr:SDR family oxidoreductase [Sphingomonadaceae bacterium]
MQKLSSHVAIVTGASSGIGQAIAIAFAREGAAVAIVHCDQREGAQATERVIKDAGGRALIIEADVREEKQVDAAAARCRAEFGPPTLLVNSAGVDAGGIKVADMTLEHWDNVLRTNLTGPFLFCRAVIRGLRDAKKRGKIINISSVHQEIPRSGAADYDASKGGLRNLTTTLALELAPEGITVNNIAPGMVLTPMNAEAIEDPEKLVEQVQSIPLKRAAGAQEVAQLAVYIASADGDYATGATFTLDGGLSINTGQGA